MKTNNFWQWLWTLCWLCEHTHTTAPLVLTIGLAGRGCRGQLIAGSMGTGRA